MIVIAAAENIIRWYGLDKVGGAILRKIFELDPAGCIADRDAIRRGPDLRAEEIADLVAIRVRHFEGRTGHTRQNRSTVQIVGRIGDIPGNGIVVTGEVKVALREGGVMRDVDIHGRRHIGTGCRSVIKGYIIEGLTSRNDRADPLDAGSAVKRYG